MVAYKEGVCSCDCCKSDYVRSPVVSVVVVVVVVKSFRNDSDDIKGYRGLSPMTRVRTLVSSCPHVPVDSLYQCNC